MKNATLLFAATILLLFTANKASAQTATVAMAGTITNTCTLSLGTAPDNASVATMLKSRGTSTVSFSLTASCDSPGMAIWAKSLNGGFKGTITGNTTPQQYSVTLTPAAGSTLSSAAAFTPQATSTRVNSMTTASVTANVTVKDNASFPTMPDTYSDSLTFSLVAE